MPARKRLIQLATSVAVLALAACSGGGGVSNPNGSGGPPSGGDPPALVTLASLEIAPSASGGIQVSVGSPVHFTARATYSDATTADVTGEVVWASSNTSAAAFSATAGNGVLDPLAAGTTSVTAAHPDGVAASVDVTVSPLALYDDPDDPAASPIAISPVSPTILTGTTVPFAASATLEDLSVVDYTANVIWSSSDEAVATISSTGQATAGDAVGTATITATDPVTGATDSTTLTVTDVPAALGYVVLSRGSVIGGSEIEVIGTVVLTSKATPTQSVTISLWASLWGSSDVGPIAEAEVPATVTVAANEDRQTFVVSHHEVLRRTRVAIHAKDENPAPPIVKSSSLWIRRPR